MFGLFTDSCRDVRVLTRCIDRPSYWNKTFTVNINLTIWVNRSYISYHQLVQAAEMSRVRKIDSDPKTSTSELRNSETKTWELGNEHLGIPKTPSLQILDSSSSSSAMLIVHPIYTSATQNATIIPSVHCLCIMRENCCKDADLLKRRFTLDALLFK